MNARPPDGSDEPEAVDQVMLAVLSNRGRDATLLSADQERLLDDWVAGRLAPDDAERAAALVRQNALAAERVLERPIAQACRQRRARLFRSSSRRNPQGERATEGVSVRVPGGARLAAGSGRASRAQRRWRRSWWSPACRCLQRIRVSGGGPLQVAMVTISDRGPPVRGVTDLRMRGTTPPRLVPRPGNASAMSKCRPACSRNSLRRPASPRAQHPRDRTLRPRYRRNRRSSRPCDRGLLLEAADRHGRSQSNCLFASYDLERPRVRPDVRSLVGLPPGTNGLSCSPSRP